MDIEDQSESMQKDDLHSVRCGQNAQDNHGFVATDRDPKRILGRCGEILGMDRCGQAEGYQICHNASRGGREEIRNLRWGFRSYDGREKRGMNIHCFDTPTVV